MSSILAVTRPSTCLMAFALLIQPSFAGDWAQFRGSNGAGISTDANVPATWNDTENLRWKIKLPGPGSSSPIVLGNKIFVTCYSGYGIPKAEGGDLKALQRHLVCVDRTNGEIRWTKDVQSELPEDNYQGYISEHGYASSTPVSDGEMVYCFFGKSSVVAFDLEGKQVWHVDVGKESSNRRWGSGASLILYKDFVIVNAAEESRSIRSLNKKTGQLGWKAVGAALELAYGTPLLMTTSDRRQDLVIAVPGEVWALNPDTGKMRWYAEHQLTGNICPSVVANGDTVYIFGGFRSAGSLAIQLGGDGNVKNSQTLWSSRNSSYVATPVFHDGHLYWVDDRGQAYCISAASGELVYRERVAEIEASGRPVYASPVLANGKIYVPTRWSGVLVLPAKPEYKLLAQNRFPDDDSDFNATPTISDGELILRSNKNLYCVGGKKK